MTTKAATSTTVVLDGPQDWMKWDELFKGEAIANGLWDAINPASPTVGRYLPSPIEPDVTTYDKRLDADDNNDNASASRGAASTQPAGPITRSAASTQTARGSQTPQTQVTGDDEHAERAEPHAPSAPRSTKELTTASREAYQIDLSCFYEMRRQYDKQMDRVALLKRWVNKHVSEHYRSIDCKAEKPIHEWYANLKKYVGSPPVYEKVQAEEAYQKAIQPPSRPPKAPMEWMKNRERAITQRRRSRSPQLRNKSKRKYTGGTESECPGCKKPGHTLPKCWIVFPEKAPVWFKVPLPTKERVDEHIQQDEELRREVEHLRKKKKKRS